MAPLPQVVSCNSSGEQKLFAAGRIQDAERAVKDENYRAQLFKEFQIA